MPIFLLSGIIRTCREIVICSSSRSNSEWNSLSVSGFPNLTRQFARTANLKTNADFADVLAAGKLF